MLYLDSISADFGLETKKADLGSAGVVKDLLLSKLLSTVFDIALAELLIGASSPTNARIPIHAFFSLFIIKTS